MTYAPVCVCKSGAGAVFIHHHPAAQREGKRGLSFAYSEFDVQPHTDTRNTDEQFTFQRLSLTLDSFISILKKKI